MGTFNLKKFLTENKLTEASRLVREETLSFALKFVAFSGRNYELDIDIASEEPLQATSMRRAIEAVKQQYEEGAQEFWEIIPLSRDMTWIGLSDEGSALIVSSNSELYPPRKEWTEHEWDVLEDIVHKWHEGEWNPENRDNPYQYQVRKQDLLDPEASAEEEGLYEMDTFNLKKFLTENKLTKVSSLIREDRRYREPTKEELQTVIAAIGEVYSAFNHLDEICINLESSVNLVGWASEILEEEDNFEISDELIDIASQIVGFGENAADTARGIDMGFWNEEASYARKKRNLIPPSDEDLYEGDRRLRLLSKMDPETHQAKVSSIKAATKLAKGDRYGLSPMGWRDRKDRPYDGTFDFEYDEEEFEDYDSYRTKYPDYSDNWFGPGDHGRKFFDMHKPLKVRSRRIEETHSAKDKLPPAVMKKLDSMADRLSKMEEQGKEKTPEYRKLNKEYLALEKEHGL